LIQEELQKEALVDCLCEQGAWRYGNIYMLTGREDILSIRYIALSDRKNVNGQKKFGLETSTGDTTHLNI